MPRIDTSFVKQVPIIDIARKLGIEVRGTKAMCFSNHDKNTPSLSFMPRTNYWKCFGACGKHGDGIALVQQVLDVDFKTAVEWFQRNFSVGLPIGASSNGAHSHINTTFASKKSSSVLRKQSHPFARDPEVYDWLIEKCASVTDPRGLDYLESHGIPQETAKRFGLRELCDPNRALRELIKNWGHERVYRSGLAWGSEGRPERLIWSSYALLLPFRENQLTTYVQGRLFLGRMKFLGPQGIEKPIFNMDRLRTLPAGSRLHICEGVPDALAMESKGLAAVAILGATSFREEWVDSFLKFDIFLLPDGDKGGDSFWKKTSKLFADRAKQVRRIELPVNQDVADVMAQMRKNR